jgi:hypothetical protein
MLGLAICLLLYGALLVMKWPVAPVSATIVGVDSIFGGEEALGVSSKSNLDLPFTLFAVPLSYFLVRRPLIFLIHPSCYPWRPLPCGHRHGARR